MYFFKLSLSLQMLIATLLGIGAGIFFGDHCEVLAPFASAYILILKITALPYLIVAIIRGVGQLSGSQSFNILKKGILFICGAWIINIVMIYTIVFLFPSAKGTRITSYSPTEPPPINFAEWLIPDNIFYSLSNNVVPAIVIFCILLGISLIHNQDKNLFLGLLGNIQSLLTRITNWISRITPIGTFLIISKQFGTINLATIKQVSTYIILYILIVSLCVFWIFPRIISYFTNLKARQWVKGLAPILLLAYTTNFVIVCLPFIIEMLQRQLANEMGYEDEKAQNEVQGIVSVVFNLPLSSLFISVFVLFLTIFYNAPLTIAGNAQLLLTTFLTSLGAVGLGSWINSLSFILDSLLLPTEAIDLYLTTLPFTSGFQSMLSVMEISALAFLITLACHKKLQYKIPRLLHGSLVTFGPVFLIALATKLLNPLPPIQSASKSIFDLSIESTVPVKVLSTAEPKTLDHYDSALDRIKQTGVIRVGYIAYSAPLSFFNSHKELAGFDIAFAYELAYDLGCRLEFIPINYPTIVDQVNQGFIDIAMTSVSMTEPRIQNAFFSSPYLTSNLILVMNKEMKHKYKNSSLVFGDTSLRIAAVKSTSYALIAQQLFSDHPLVLLDNLEDFAKKDVADVLIWDDLEAIAWILHHPSFRILIPSPPIGADTFAYLLPQGDIKFLEFINNWLILKKNEGFYDHQYDLWIKGKTEKVTPQTPRWSIVRDVLHWR